MIPGAGTSAKALSYSYLDSTVVPNRSYYYKLANINFSGEYRYHGPIVGGIATAVSAHGRFGDFVLPELSGPVQSANFDQLFLKVWRCCEADHHQQRWPDGAHFGARKPVGGNYTVQWNGRDGQGRMMTSGIYLHRLEMNGFSKIKRLVFSK